MGLALSNQLLVSEFCFSLDVKKIKVILFSLAPLAVTSISLFLSLIFSLENLGYMYWFFCGPNAGFFLLTKVCLISSEIALICFLSPTWMQREHVILFFSLIFLVMLFIISTILLFHFIAFRNQNLVPLSWFFAPQSFHVSNSAGEA